MDNRLAVALAVAGFMATVFVGIILERLTYIRDTLSELKRWQAVHEQQHKPPPPVWPGGP